MSVCGFPGFHPITEIFLVSKSLVLDLASNRPTSVVIMVMGRVTPNKIIFKDNLTDDHLMEI